MESETVEPQRCHNHFCGKTLTEEDKTTSGGFFSEPVFFSIHICNECWAKFDGQKMRGRFRMQGIPHGDLVRLGALMDQQVEGGCPFEVGHPSDEQRYTESLSEWISWQGGIKCVN